MERVGVEIERKYIIEKPDIETLRGQEGFTESNITQIYLESEGGITHRIRKREECGSCTFTETKKIRIDKMSSTEIEGNITADEFARLSASIRRGSRPIIKTRYTFLYKGQLFELDFYPEWTRLCIMETELDCQDRQVVFPDFIRVTCEVTGIKEFSNSSMANSFPKEEAL